MSKTIDPDVAWFTRPDKPSFKNLKALRHKLTSRHSLKEISERTKIDQGVLSQYDKAGVIDSETNAKAVAKDLDCPHELLMAGATKEMAKLLATSFTSHEIGAVPAPAPEEVNGEALMPVGRKIGVTLTPYKPLRISTKEQKLHFKNLTTFSTVLLVQRLSDEEIEISVCFDKKHSLQKNQTEVWLPGMVTRYEHDSVLSNRRMVWSDETITI